MKKKVVVGMSGGIDSSVSAYLLKQKGYEVIGVSLKLYPEVSKCCRLEDIEDARRVAETLGIPHYAADYTPLFKKIVIDYFAKEYISGRTPNPCALCNKEIKFRILFEKAQKMGADYLATGHYARIVYREEQPFLAPAKDRKKSQEYFLSLIEPSKLKHVIFPLGEYTKEEVKKISLQADLPIRKKKESQDVCFVGEGGYLEFLRKNYKINEEAGPIIDSEGNLLGWHDGYLKYTIGQRKGLGISSSQPYYVIKIIPEKNTIVVGTKKQAYSKTIRVKPVIWRGKVKGNYKVKIRYNHTPTPAEVKLLPQENELLVHFSEAQFAPTPGQVAVFYDRDNLVIGAGFIENLINN